MNIFSKIAAGLKKTKDSMMGKLETLMNSFTKIDEEFFEELEELLITCDIGVETSLDICGELRKKVKEKGITDPALIKDELKEIIEQKGGKVTGSVTSKTECLINNDYTSNSGKNKKAKELQIPILTEDEFIEKYLNA